MNETIYTVRYESTWSELLTQLEDAFDVMDVSAYSSAEAWMESWLGAEADGIGVSVAVKTVGGKGVPYLALEVDCCTDLGLIAYVAQALHNLGGYEYFREIAVREYADKYEQWRKESEMAYEHEEHLMQTF